MALAIGAVSGVGVLATYAYDNLGRRTGVTRGNGTSTAYTFDPVSRFASLAHDFTGTTNDLTIGSMAYNPASQIISQNRSNDLFAWTGHGSGSTASVANGLNQLTTIGGAATTHDTKGNLTTDPTTGKTYTYSSENLLKTATGGAAATLAYDPMLRLYDVTGAATTRFAYDGLDAIAEYDAGNVLQKRFVHRPGTDEPLVEYVGAGTASKTWLHADERGSIVAVSDASGNATTINRYDEYGKPQATNAGRFQYTGQMWLPELAAYYYKARVYLPTLGRFLQPDPIDVAGGINLYAYVDNDPVNFVDSLGLAWPDNPCVMVGNKIVCVASGVGVGSQGGIARRHAIKISGGSSDTATKRLIRSNPSACPTTTSPLGQLATSAGNLSESAAYLALGSGVLAIATSETVIGGLTFTGIAFGLGAVSAGAAFGKAGLEYLDKNPAAIATAAGAAVGVIVPPATSRALRLETAAERLTADAIGQGYGHIATSIGCSYVK